MKIDIDWFKNNILPKIGNSFKIDYSYFANGDFGDLNRIEFEGRGKGGTVEFWSLGWLGIHVVNYETGVELFNILLEPNQEVGKINSFKKLQELLDR